MSPHIRLVSFDLWSTLWEDKFQLTARASILRAMLHDKGKDISLDEAKQHYLEKCSQYEEALSEEHQYRHIPFQQRLTQFFNSYDLTITEREMDAIIHQINQAFLADPPELFHGVKEILPKLAERYKLIIISDTGFVYGHIMRKQLQIYGIAENFAEFYFSDETGVYKPHQRAFQAAMNDFAFEPHACLHVGDRARTDVIGANQAGWTSVLLDNHSIPEKRANYEESEHSEGLTKPKFVISDIPELLVVLDALESTE